MPYSWLFLNSYRYYYTLKFKHINKRKFIKFFASTSAYTTTSQLYAAILTGLLTLLPQGYLASYRYISVLFNSLVNISFSTINITFFTNISNFLATKKIKNSKKLIYQTFSLGMLVTIFLIICNTLFGYDALTLLWQNSKFPAKLIKFCYLYLYFSLFCMFIYFPGILFHKTLISLNKGNSLYLLHSICQLTMIIIAYFSITYFSYYGILILSVADHTLRQTVSIILIYIFKKDFIKEIIPLIKKIFISFTIIFSLSLAIGHYLYFNTENKFHLFIIVTIKLFIAIILTYTMYKAYNYKIKYDNGNLIKVTK